MVRRTGGSTTLWYYQDGRGNTSHVGNDSGALLERYTYHYAGNANIYDPAGNPRPNGSAYANRFLFQGRDYSSELGLYDYRNRIYFPEWGRFLQPDPIGHKGDSNNLYRYCANSAMNYHDPSGLDYWFGIDIDSTPVNRWWGLAPFGVSFTTLSISVTDPRSGAGYRTFDSNTIIGPATQNGSYSGPHFSSSPAQDLVVGAALANSGGNWSNYEQVTGIIQDALYRHGVPINPVDPFNGQIRDAHFNLVGWEDPYTGNIYDRNWNWAAWDPDWEQTFLYVDDNDASGRVAGGNVGGSGGPISSAYGGVAGMFGGTMAPGSTLGTNFVPGWFGSPNGSPQTAGGGGPPKHTPPKRLH